MNATTKKSFTPAPRMNVMKDQLKEQRFGLITKVKALREQRQALKGVKGTGKQWAEICTQIDEVQSKIDLLSKSLGLPVKSKTNHVVYDRSNTDLGRAVMDTANGKSKVVFLTTDENGHPIPNS